MTFTKLLNYQFWKLNFIRKYSIEMISYAYILLSFASSKRFFKISGKGSFNDFWKENNQY